MSKCISIIPGDGIGPEIMAISLRVIQSALQFAQSAPWEFEICEAGEKVFSKGDSTGVPIETIHSISRSKVAFKGPLATPVGKGEKSANVTLRKYFETYANVRPAKELPGVLTPFSGRGIDLVVVRENVEDLYAGIEYMQTESVAECLKLISRLGSEKILRFAYELARAEGRKVVTCATKANIMKLSEGLFKEVFEELSLEYSDIKPEHMIVDNLAHQLVIRPENFSVIVATNMNGDIISDLTSGLIGGLGFAPSANLGSEVAIFESVHGTAPDIAGKDIANPTALILTGAMMLRYTGEVLASAALENALLYVLEKGEIVTADIKAAKGKIVGTKAFGEEVISALGKEPQLGAVKNLKPFKMPQVDANSLMKKVSSNSRDIGVDIYLQCKLDPKALGEKLESMLTEIKVPFKLKLISNRGAKVYPPSEALTDCIDHYRCRFMYNGEEDISTDEIFKLTKRIGEEFRWMHLEKLLEVDGVRRYSLAQGE
jgi:isocitrate dehydrogenase